MPTINRKPLFHFIIGLVGFSCDFLFMPVFGVIFHGNFDILKENERSDLIMNTYAYARVSARDQNLQRQIDAFIEYGIERNHIFLDKKSGKDFERKGYKRLLKKLKSGDVLVIKSIDRLGRNYDAIIAEWSYITNTVGADILVLDMPILNTRTKADTLVSKFISDVVLQVLSFVAENERENIKQRQADGIRIAKQNGVKFGRPKRQYTDEFLTVAKDYICNRISSASAIKILNIKRENFYYHIRQIKNL